MHWRHSSPGLQMGGFLVPPRADKGLRGSPLGDLSMAFVEGWDSDGLKKYAKGLADAGTDEIERARPQIYHTLNSLGERLKDSAFNITYGIEKGLGYGNSFSDPAKLTGHILRGVISDADELLKACDAAPKNQYKLRQLATCIDYLAEMNVVCESLSRDDGRFRPLAERANGALVRIATAAVEFRDAVGERYPQARDHIRDISVVREEAATRVSETPISLPRLSKGRFDRALSTIGDQNVLWQIAGSEDRRAAAAKTPAYRPIDDKGAADIASEVGSLMGDMDAVFNSHGFVGGLVQLAVSLRYQALNKSAWAEEYGEGYIKRSRKSLYESKEEHAARIERDLLRLPSERLDNLKSAANLGAEANVMASFVNAVSIAVKGKPAAAFLAFRREGAALVGEVDVPGRDAIVIYDDHIVREGGRHPDAVYAVRLPASEMAGGLPPLEDVRERFFERGTNYHSLVEALSELDGDIERSYFFDGLHVAGHDAFEVMDGAVHLRDEEPLSGPRP